MTVTTTARTIRIFLAEGNASGVLTAEIMNWTGKVIVAPRTRLPGLLARLELSRTGVYFLIGPDPAVAGRTMIYVGEGDAVGARIKQHNAAEAKEFFTKVCVLVSKDENLTKAHVRHLESRFISAIKLAGNASLLNKDHPGFSNLPESDLADMDFFINQVEMVLPVLGFDFMLKPVIFPPSASLEPTTLESPEFEMEAAGVKAKAREAQGKFVVLKNSNARAQTVPSFVTYKQLRERLIAERKLVPASNSDLLSFSDDTPFDSPSAAAAIVAGRNENGRIRWRIVGSGQTYSDWQNSLLPKSPDQDDE